MMIEMIIKKKYENLTKEEKEEIFLNLKADYLNRKQNHRKNMENN